MGSGLSFLGASSRNVDHGVPPVSPQAISPRTPATKSRHNRDCGNRILARLHEQFHFGGWDFYRFRFRVTNGLNGSTMAGRNRRQHDQMASRVRHHRSQLPVSPPQLGRPPLRAAVKPAAAPWHPGSRLLRGGGHCPQAEPLFQGGCAGGRESHFRAQAKWVSCGRRGQPPHVAPAFSTGRSSRQWVGPLREKPGTTICCGQPSTGTACPPLLASGYAAELLRATGGIRPARVC
jgi:hypothetical protein